MKCPKCSFENKAGSIFCNECGSKLEIPCPSCGEVNQPGSKFCNKCGQNLQADLKTKAVDYKTPQTYTPKHLADKILTTRSSIEGERKLVTVLFADVANFTAISEKLDPEEIHQIMDSCFKILMDEIHKYEGTINQFTGDGVMALFGAPLAHEDHARNASYAALSIQKLINIYGKKISEDCEIEFKMRIGINSGPVVVGSIGDDLRMDYTAIGDTTNLAARMESMAVPGNVWISENTYRLIKAYFECENLGSMSVKGKKEPQQTYKLVKSSEVHTRIEASVSKGLVRFVGRENSYAAIQKIWGKTINGSGQILGVVGEAGVGKSRLLLEFRNSLANGDINYLEGRCLHYGGSMVYLPFLDIIKAVFEIGENHREDFIKKNIQEKLTALDKELLIDSQPVFEDLLSLKVENKSWLKLKPKNKRARTFETLRNLFVRLSEKKPLIIVVEDLHWIDKTSEEFLSFFINSMAHSPILLILLYRPEYTHQWGSKSYYNKIGLDQLAIKPCAELVSAILEGGEVASELEKLIFSRSAGNPLFMEEFTHALLENGSIERKKNQFVLSGKINEIRVPGTIQGIIAARMDRLEENLKRTMQVASVIGRDFAFRILQSITGMRKELKSDLLNLQGLEFIYEKNLFPELEYIFKHALTQEVAYNSLLNKRRKEIHEKIGRAIELIHAEKLSEFYEMLAYHYQKSKNVEKSFHYLKMSGRKAIDKNSHWEALSHYKAALTLLKKQPDTEENKKEQLNIIISMFTSLHQLGFPEDSIQLMRDGEKLSKELDLEDKLAGCLSILGVYYTYRGNQAKAVNYTEQSYKVAQKVQNIRLMSASSQGLCTSYFVSGKIQEVVNIAPNSIASIEKKRNESAYFAGGFNSYSIICGYCGVSYAYLGNFIEAESLCEKGYSLALKIDHIPSLAWIETMYGYLYLIKGDGKNIIKYSERSIKHMEEGQVSFMLGMPWGALSRGYWFEGEFETSLNYAEKALKIQLKTGNPFFLSMNYLALGIVQYSIEDSEQAQNNTQKACQLSEQIGEKHLEATSNIWFGRILGKVGKIDKAIQYIFHGIDICKELKIIPERNLGYQFLGELYVKIDQKEKALKYLKMAENNFQDMGMEYWLDKVRDCLNKL